MDLWIKRYDIHIFYKIKIKQKKGGLIAEAGILSRVCMGEEKGCSHWANSLLVIGFGFEFTRGVGSGLTEFLTARFRLQMHSDGDERCTAATRLMAPTLDLEADGATGGTDGAFDTTLPFSTNKSREPPS